MSTRLKRRFPPALLAAVAVALTAPFLPAAAARWSEAALARIERPPLGLPPVPLPDDNRPTTAKIDLGRKLFFDRRLSSNNTMSCAMCHVPEQGFTNNELSTAVGVEGRSGRRNAPALYNVAYATSLFHDGRETSLETQIFGPLLARNEMNNPSVGWLVEKIRRLDDYPRLFEATFGKKPDAHTIGEALASYERTLLSGNSVFDRWRYGGEKNTMTASAVRGFELFTGKGGCSACHTIDEEHALFTDHELHNTGIGAARDAAASREGPPLTVEMAPGLTVSLSRARLAEVGHPPLKDFGRLEVTDDPTDLYRYRTPSLRNVALTAPYMHDGSLRTLDEVVRYYDKGGFKDKGLDPLMQPLGLDDDEVSALVAFLESLTGDNTLELTDDARSIAVGN